MHHVALNVVMLVQCAKLELVDAKFHEPPILPTFGLELQIMIHLIILATEARDANIMDITGGPLWCR